MSTSGRPLPPVRAWILYDDEYRLPPDKTPWRGGEEWLHERHGWSLVNEPTHDAINAAGETVEIKTPNWQYQDGRNGVAKIWEKQYFGADRLALVVRVDVDEDESYVLGYVTIPMIETPGETLEVRHSTMGLAAHCRFTDWTDVLELGDIRFGLRHAFVDVLDDPDDAIVMCAPGESTSRPPEHRKVWKGDDNW